MFHKNKTRKSGRNSMCVVCTSDYGKEYRTLHAEERRQKSKEYYRVNVEHITRRSRHYRDSNREYVNSLQRKQYANNRELLVFATQKRRALEPEKEYARYVIQYAVRCGKIFKPRTCEDCGDTKPPRQLHGHHEDYGRPLRVRWLCALCHGKQHRLLLFPKLSDKPVPDARA